MYTIEHHFLKSYLSIDLYQRLIDSYHSYQAIIDHLYQAIIHSILIQFLFFILSLISLGSIYGFLNKKPIKSYLLEYLQDHPNVKFNFNEKNLIEKCDVKNLKKEFPMIKTVLPNFTCKTDSNCESSDALAYRYSRLSCRLNGLV